MTAHRLALTALAALLLPAASLAQDGPQTLDLDTAEGAMSLDMNSVKDRSGRKAGRKVVKADVVLAAPFHRAGMEIARETQTQEWNCDSSRYRVVLREYFTSTGQYVYGEREYTPWNGVPKEGPERKAFETLCPQPAD